jgi:hypothetical protein
MRLIRQNVRLHTGGNGCASLHWLLVESCFLASCDEETSGPYRNKEGVISTMLLGDQPLQGGASYVDHSLVTASPACDDKRL